MMNQKCDVIVIKGGCGLGKSYEYSNILSSGKALDNYVVALPTNKAKRHIYNDEFCTKTSEHLPLVTPDLDEVKDNEIEKLLSIGAFGQLKRYAETYIERTPTNNVVANNIRILKNYLEINEKVKDYPYNILTTHSRSFYLPYEVEKSHIYLYDEDILSESIKIISVPLKMIIDTLPNLKKSKKLIEDKINKAIGADYKKIIPVKSEIWYQDEIDEEIKDSKGIYCNINDLLRCSAVARDNKKIGYVLKNRSGQRDDDIIWLLVENVIPKKKCIILSATADEQLYKDYFEKKLKRNVKWYEAPKVKNAGKIIQHYSYTYSRYSLNKNPKILEDIRSEYNDRLLITFNEFIDKDRERMGLEVGYGKFEGLDEYNGSDFVLVGLQNKGEVYHKMLEYAIYGEIHNEAKINYSWEENEFARFKFSNYGNEYENLRRIRNWECEEALVQAVGRARLTVPENADVTIDVFARYPLERCDLCSIKILAFFWIFLLFNIKVFAKKKPKFFYLYYYIFLIPNLLPLLKI